MDKKRGLVKVTFGGWYQRTTLHLTEVYEFLANGRSRLDLSKAKLKRYHERLSLKSVTREQGYLEHIKVKTNSGIEIRYYEDGLYILEMSSDNVDKAIGFIKGYFKNYFNPAINYVFSLGTPTPKILSNIKEDHPVVVSVLDLHPSQFKVNTRKFGKVYGKLISTDVSVYKTPGIIFLVASPTKQEMLNNLIEMQIFFREFKDQLHKYLNIHREIWEDIADIKEKRFVRGKDVGKYRNRLEAYKKTINLIKYRINQMPSYAHTRASLSKNLSVEKRLVDLFQYKFEDLFSSLQYIREIWSMTVDYISAAIQVLVEIDNKTTLGGIRSIQILASIGVVTGVFGYLSQDTLPSINQFGAIYLVVLGVFAFGIDHLLKRYSKSKRYKLRFIEREKKI